MTFFTHQTSALGFKRCKMGHSKLLGNREKGSGGSSGRVRWWRGICGQRRCSLEFHSILFLGILWWAHSQSKGRWNYLTNLSESLGEKTPLCYACLVICSPFIRIQCGNVVTSIPLYTKWILWSSSIVLWLNLSIDHHTPVVNYLKTSFSSILKNSFIWCCCIKPLLECFQDSDGRLTKQLEKIIENLNELLF